MTLKRQEKIGNIFFLKQDTFFNKKMYVWHFYPKIPTGLHSGLHYLFGAAYAAQIKAQQFYNALGLYQLC